MRDEVVLSGHGVVVHVGHNTIAVLPQVRVVVFAALCPSIATEYNTGEVLYIRNTCRSNLTDVKERDDIVLFINITFVIEGNIDVVGTINKSRCGSKVESIGFTRHDRSGRSNSFGNHIFRSCRFAHLIRSGEAANRVGHRVVFHGDRNFSIAQVTIVGNRLNSLSDEILVQSNDGNVIHGCRRLRTSRIVIFPTEVNTFLTCEGAIQLISKGCPTIILIEVFAVSERIHHLLGVCRSGNCSRCRCWYITAVTNIHIHVVIRTFSVTLPVKTQMINIFRNNINITICPYNSRCRSYCIFICCSFVVGDIQSVVVSVAGSITCKPFIGCRSIHQLPSAVFSFIVKTTMVRKCGRVSYRGEWYLICIKWFIASTANGL